MRQNKNRIEFAAVVVVVFVAGALMFTASNSIYNIANAQGGQQQKNVVRDSQAILLEGKTIPAKDYIHLYDSTPYMITNGHVAAKLPCDTSNTSPLKILIGQAPNLKSSEAELVSQLSSPGKLCLYHVDLVSGNNNTITDVAIKNNSTKDIVFPPTSSVGVGVNAIAPLPPGQG